MYFKIKLMSLDLWENWNESCCYWSWTLGDKTCGWIYSVRL